MGERERGKDFKKYINDRSIFSFEEDILDNRLLIVQNTENEF